MPKKIKNNKKRSVQIRNKNKNSIHININSNNKRRGTSSGGQRQQSSHPTIIMSAPHVPYIPVESGASNLYPLLSDIKERLTIQAKRPQEVKEFVGSTSEPAIEIKKEVPVYPVKNEPVRPAFHQPKRVQVADDDLSFSSHSSSNDFPLSPYIGPPSYSFQSQTPEHGYVKCQ